MPIFLSYALVVIIWSTTPLAIYFSNDSLSSIAAVNARMIMAFVFAAALTAACFRQSFNIKQNWKTYHQYPTRRWQIEFSIPLKTVFFHRKMRKLPGVRFH